MSAHVTGTRLATFEERLVRKPDDFERRVTRGIRQLEKNVVVKIGGMFVVAVGILLTGQLIGCVR